MNVTYYGQACILVEATGRKILTDPWLTEGANLGSWFHTHLLADVGVTPASVAQQGIDYLFLSHEHQDHVDAASLQEFRDTPVLICKFPTDRFRKTLEGFGLRNIRELESGVEEDLGDGLKVTIFGTAEYTNDSAILIEGEGSSVFNETDCKLGYEDYVRLSEKQVDLGFYMFSGANWFPIKYDYPEDTMRSYVQRRRASLISSFVRRVKLTRPKRAVPSAGPCTVLDEDLFWLNSPERGIFIDPPLALDALAEAQTGSEGLYLAASDRWDSETGLEIRSPAAFREDRTAYLTDAARRMKPTIDGWKQQEPSAGNDLSARVLEYFESRTAAQAPDMRERIGAKLLVEATGPQAGQWTIDLTAASGPFAREGATDDWTYRIRTEDKCLYPFVAGQLEYFEDLLLSLRVDLARRPDVYSEPLYHFLYDPDPERLRNWYANH